MLNLYRYVKPICRCVPITSRYLSISKSELIESSRNIQELLKPNDDKVSIAKWLYNAINKIHDEYRSNYVATSTKETYQKNSSSLNSVYAQLDDDRKKQIGDFQLHNTEQLIILLRYIRYVQVAYIYRLITYDIEISLKESSNTIIALAKSQDNFNKNSVPLICELTFFLKFLCSQYPLPHVKSLVSNTFITTYLADCLASILPEKPSVELVKQICSALHSVMALPSSSTTIYSWSHALLQYVYNQRSCSLSIIEYLIFIQHNSIRKNSPEVMSLLNEYLIEIGIHQTSINVLCQLLILISSFNYSHELFIKEIMEKCKVFLKKSHADGNPLSDSKLCSRLIYYLCLSDPTNRFHSRATIVELSQKLYKNMDNDNKFAQWIIQAQHGMMFGNIYNYNLLFAVVQHQYFPNLIRGSGIYTWSILRQLFDIHHALLVDRPALSKRLLNDEMLAYATKISEEYRTSVRSEQKSYNKFLLELKDFFNKTYGDGTCIAIDTSRKHPFILFDFLEINLPDTGELNSIGIDTKQRIAVLPILNSMLIQQQRSDGSLIRVLSAHTTMRHRVIERINYQIVLIFHGEYLRAVRDNKLKTIFETNLALKTLPYGSNSDNSPNI